MSKQNDLSRCRIAHQQDATLIAVIEMGQANWLVAGIVPGLDRYPLKKLGPDRDALLQLLHRWRNEAAKAGYAIDRIAVAYEAGRDGFWLARWLRSQSIEAYVIHPSSVPVSREHRRAKTDRLDTELLKRAFLGWLRGEPKHCSMAAIPTVEDEDARRPGRERQILVEERTRIINRLKANLARLGIRGFRPNLARAPGQLEALRTPEGVAIPMNTLAEMRRDLDRLRFVKQQIKEIEKTRRASGKGAERATPRGGACADPSGRRRGRDCGHARPGGLLARDPGPEGSGALRRSHRGSRRERPKTTRARPRQSRQRPRAPRDD